MTEGGTPDWPPLAPPRACPTGRRRARRPGPRRGPTPENRPGVAPSPPHPRRSCVARDGSVSKTSCGWSGSSPSLRCWSAPPDLDVRPLAVRRRHLLDHPPRDLPRLGGARVRRRHRQTLGSALAQPPGARRPHRNAAPARALAAQPRPDLWVGEAGPGERGQPSQPEKPDGLGVLAVRRPTSSWRPSCT